LIVTRTLPAFLRSEAPANQTLTFAERVAYQRAIEDVYWRHRIWPKEQPDPKPSLDAVMSQAQLEKKVGDYLRKSQALEDYWQRPITAEQLQAEMDRMAKHTRQPEVLRELFEVLGNDPFVVAECLARPGLAERLLTNWYAYDQRIHGELKQRAETDLQAHPSVEQMREMSGTYSEIELVKSEGANGGHKSIARHASQLNSGDWDATVQKLASTLAKCPVAVAHSSAKEAPITQIKTGVVSSLQEDQERYYATAVLSKTNDHLKLATVSWLKDPVESWLATLETQVPAAMTTPTGSYRLPNISIGSTCIDDTWTATAGPPDARGGHTAVWTGTEMIVWGGGINMALNTGSRYNPSTDSWISTSATNAPTARTAHTAVWTGSEMIVWGGIDNSFNILNSGGKYDPGTGTWVTTSIVNAPAARELHTAVWTGSEMIVWGGTGANYFNSGGRYNPNTDSWTPTSTINAPAGRYGPTAVWTGSEIIVWGGTDDTSVFNTGGRYNPGTNTWAATSTTNVPDARYEHTAVWTGGEMIVWGGTIDGGEWFDTGGRYNPGTNSWTPTSIINVPPGQYLHTAVWTGSQMIVWGGYGESNFANTGGRYNPSMNSWTTTSTANAPTARSSHTAVWTGTEMIVWGGFNSGAFNTGGRYDPSMDSWMPTGSNSAPSA